MKCFREISERKGTCKDCRQKRSPFRKLATCFDSFGTGKTLLEKYKKYRSNEKDLAAFIVLQLEALEFAPFEVIVDVPSYFSSPFRMIAKEVAKMLCLIRVPILKRSLTPRPHFSLKKKCSIINKKVLLLSSEMHSREEVQAAGWALKEGRPEVIDGMTFCATLH